MSKKYKNDTHSYLQTQELHRKKRSKWKKVKKANSPAHPLVRAKKEFIALIIKKIELIKYYFEVSENFFPKKVIIIINSPKFKKSNFNNVISWVPSSVQILH